MWETLGPRPGSIYWRRRAFAVVAALAAIVLVIWSAVVLTRATADEAAPAGAVRPSVESSFAFPTPVESAVPAPVGSAVAAPVAPTPTALPATSPTPTPAATPAPTPIPAVPVPCTNAMIQVLARIDPPEHRVGQRPVFRLVVTNTSDQPCVRDLDPARQEIVVWSGDGAARLWSSNDCTNPSIVDERTLVPEQPIAFAVTWAGRTSTPGCAVPRTVVPSGAYRVTVRVDDLVSAPTPLLRNPG